jgi:hypothetical protein
MLEEDIHRKDFNTITHAVTASLSGGLASWGAGKKVADRYAN